MYIVAHSAEGLPQGSALSHPRGAVCRAVVLHTLSQQPGWQGSPEGHVGTLRLHETPVAKIDLPLFNKRCSKTVPHCSSGGLCSSAHRCCGALDAQALIDLSSLLALRLEA